jgi:hypothetical protein
VGPGKFNLNANYNQDTRGPAGGPDLKHRAELFGGNYVFGPYRINAGWIHYTAEQLSPNAGGGFSSLPSRTDHAWTGSGSWRVAKTVLSLGYVRMGGENAGHNGAGVILNPMFANTAAATGTTPSGAKTTVFGAIMYQADRALDLYFAADRMSVTGGWIVGDAQGNGTRIGAGQPSQDELELAIGARLKF